VEPAAAPQTEHDYLWHRRQELRVRALTNRRYQLERQRVMEWREGAVKVASLAAGSVAIARIADPVLIYSAVAVIFVGTSASLVFGWGNKARDAAKRAAEWVAIDADIAAAGERDFSEDQLNAWEARCNLIESGEPAANLVLLETCQQLACDALGRSVSGEHGIARWRFRIPHAFRPIP